MPAIPHIDLSEGQNVPKTFSEKVKLHRNSDVFYSTETKRFRYNFNLGTHLWAVRKIDRFSNTFLLRLKSELQELDLIHSPDREITFIDELTLP